MGVRLPRANTAFNSLINSDLGTQGQNVVDGLTAAATDYPDPPVDVADLQGLVNDYNTALAASIGGSKQQRATMHAARLALRNGLRSDAAYVNQVAWLMVQSGSSYSDVQESILSTGYFLSTDPSPAGPLPAPTVRRYGSPNKGQIYILLNKVPNAAGYVCAIVDTTLGSDAIFQTFSNTRINIFGLRSGSNYAVQIATIGSNPTRDFGTQIFQVVI